MGRIRNRNTKPELVVRSLLHRLGYRFTINGPLNKKLPGRPDIVLPKHRTAIFVHGCFWHRHEGCRGTTTPKTRTEWWLNKLGSNAQRDKNNQTALNAAGWNVLVVWECESQKTHALTSFLDRRIRRIASYRVDPSRKDLPLAAEEPGYYRAKRPGRKGRTR